MKYQRALNYLDLAISKGASKAIPGTFFKNKFSQHFQDKLESLKGVPAKINQIKSMKSMDVIRTQAYSLEDVSPSDPSFEEVIVNSEITDRVLAASLGQVHFIDHIKFGECALKIQFPGASEWLKMDSSMMNLSMKAFQSFNKGFNTKAYQDFFSDELNDELNYPLEASKQSILYKYWLNENNRVIIPEVYSVGKHWILMRAEPSLELKDFLEIATPAQKQEAQKLVQEFYFKSMFNGSLIHADPNPGNIGFRISGSQVQLVVYDYGSVIQMPPEHGIQLLKIFEILTNNQQGVVQPLESLGFDVEGLSGFSNKIDILFEILLEPFLSPVKYELSNWSRSKRVKELLGEDKWQFMASAPIHIFAYMRAFHGLVFYTNALLPAIYTKPLILKIIEQNREKLSQIKYTDQSTTGFKLFINYKEAGLQKVKVTFPLKSLFQLEAIIPPDIITALQAQNIGISDIKAKALESGLEPQILFRLEDGLKDIRVYIA